MREIVPSSAVDGRAMIGLPPLRSRGAADEVHLAADARVEQRAQRVGADLAGQVDLDGRVDGDHALVLGDDEGVVGVVGRVELDDRVVVDEVVERACEPSTKLATILPGWSVLRSLVMTPASMSGSTPSENISVWMPRSWRSPR